MNGIGALHFVGIGGIGMSALARLALADGLLVSGSTDRESELTRRLAAEGATIHLGHRAENVGAPDLVIVSSAVAPDNPEVAAARARSVSVLSRGEMLSRFFNDRRGIAIAGTHGKTTTTSMVALILEQAGYDPTVTVGGERLNTGSNAHRGSGPWFVTESDESDRSFLYLRPHIAVVTNIENDHITADAEIPRLRADFTAFLANMPESGIAVVGADNVASRELASQQRAARTVTCGFAPDADVRALAPAYRDFGSTFTVVRYGEKLGDIRLAVPGEMNVENALAAATAALEAGIGFDVVARALESFRGVRRRFEMLARTERMTVVDDYAHHPTAVAATIASARANFDGPIVAVFQPHRYSRTAYLASEFAAALRGADIVVLTDVYAASEPRVEGVDRRTIGAPLEALGANVAYCAVGDLPGYLLENVPEGALVLMLGAGDITASAAALARILDPQLVAR